MYRLLHNFTVLCILWAGLFAGIIASAQSFKSSCINIYSDPGVYGDHFFLDAVNPLRPLPEKLKVFTQNFENLGTFFKIFREKKIVNGVMTEVRRQATEIKSENQLIRLAKRIKMQDPDVIVGIEVKDIDAAQDYVRKYLDDKYHSILVEGNDERGIDVCYFVKRDLAVDLEVESFKRYSVEPDPKKPTFSRDFLLLKIRPAGAPKSSRPVMALAANHYKSRLGSKPGADDTVPKRMKQVKASMNILAALQEQFPGLPVGLSGDLNNDIRTAIEFKPFYEQGYKDAMDFSQIETPLDQRFTQYFFEGAAGTVKKLITEQLDVMFVNPALSKFVVSSVIQRDVDVNGVETPMPQGPKSVNKRGSDHDGLITIFDLAGLLNYRN